MSGVVQPTPAPNVELELAKLANEAMANGVDPHDVTGKLHQTISYLRQFPKMAEHAANALADGVATPADISRTLWPHVQAASHATGPNAPTASETGGGSDSTLGAFGRSLVATGANVAQGIPGMEAVEAGVGAAASHVPGFRGPDGPISYRESLQTLRGLTDKLPTALKYGERIAGAFPLAAVLPGSAAASGAIVGGADQALNADPDMSLTERGVRTGLGVAGGALLGKVTDVAVTGAKSLMAPKPASLLLKKQAERAGSANKLYGAALQEGRNNAMTPEIQQFLAEPDIAEIVGELKSTRPFANVAEDSPEMLDAVYKTLADRAGVVKKGLQAVTPNRPNIGRFRGEDINAAKGQALDAMSGTPGYSPMPGYAAAVQDYAQRTREIEAIQKGYDALRSSLSDNLPTAKNLTRKTPEAFADWAAKAAPEDVQAARQGILGGTKMSMHPSANPFKLFGIPSMVSKAGRGAALLRDANTPSQTYLALLQNLGLLGAGSAASP